jgi:hypothetical protein
LCNFPQFTFAEVAAMRSVLLLAPVMGLLLIAVSLPGQNVNPMHPEEISAQKHASPDDMRARTANVQLQKDARELSELCAAMPSDLDGVKQGLMSKDVLEKLKRMEKLSRHVREMLTQTSPAP